MKEYTLCMPDSQELVWRVATHEHKEHSTDWYWALGLIALVGAGLSIYFGNLLLAIILVLGLGSIGWLKVRGPREHEVHISARGIAMDGTLYPWKNIHSFWVNADETKGGPCIYLSTESFLHPRITVPLDDDDHATEVRAFCKRFAKEEEHSPRFGEHLAEILGL